MIIYFPESVMELPLISKAAEMLDMHSDLYEVPEVNLKQSTILDPVKNFLSLYFNESDENSEEIINYLAQNFYSVKGTRKVIEFLYKFNLLSSDCTVTYRSSKRLEISLGGSNIKTWMDENGRQSTIDYCSEEYINRLREFLKALLYFGNLDMRLNTLTISIDLVNNGSTFGDVELFIIEKAQYEGS